jgi:hypothetical protein
VPERPATARQGRHGQVHGAETDRRAYPKGTVVSDAELAAIKIAPDPFHGEWNYSIHPD